MSDGVKLTNLRLGFIEELNFSSPYDEALDVETKKTTNNNLISSVAVA